MTARAVELFCGLGGASEGLKRAGVEIACAVDGWDRAVEAHRRWHPDVPVVQARCETAHAFLDLPVDLVWASPSCKPYSTANRTPKRGRNHPEFYDLAFLVRQAFGGWRARWLIVENVGGLLWSKEGKAELALMRAEAERLRVRMHVSVVNSNTVGVAQIRRRVIIVVGPEYVEIPHGADYIPPAGAAPSLMACEGSKGSWEPETRWPKAAADNDAVRAGTLARRSAEWDRPRTAMATALTSPQGAASAPLKEGGHGRSWAAAKGVVANEHSLARSRTTLERWRERQVAERAVQGDSATRRENWERRHGRSSFGGSREAAVGALDASPPSRHANWTQREGWHGGRGDSDPKSAVRGVLRDDRHPNGRMSKRGDVYRDGGEGRTLADCCDLQQIPLAVIEGFSKRDAHALVGNACPPPLIEHVIRVLLRADAELPEMRPTHGRETTSLESPGVASPSLLQPVLRGAQPTKGEDSESLSEDRHRRQNGQ